MSQLNVGHGPLHFKLACYSQVCPQGVSVTGDSLIRLLLNIPGIQTELACALLHKLPDAMEAQGSQEAEGLPGLILGSLRWCLAGPPNCLHDSLVRYHTHTCLYPSGTARSYLGRQATTAFLALFVQPGTLCHVLTAAESRTNTESTKQAFQHGQMSHLPQKAAHAAMQVGRGGGCW